jgi:hypothetical protein
LAGFLIGLIPFHAGAQIGSLYFSQKITERGPVVDIENVDVGHEAIRQKHSEAKGKERRDGTDDNLSWNCGIEGPPHDPAISELRDRQTGNMLAILMLSQGVPMIRGGDEISRTQQGNNNTYCQDNELSWFDWKLDRRDMNCSPSPAS